jgi:membrane peptidoglycan carboxypeptidase
VRIDYPRAGRRGVLRWWPSWRQWLFMGGLAVLLGVVGFGALYASTAIPVPNKDAVGQATIVYYADGRNELGRLGDVNRTSIPLSSVPVHVQQAVLAAEDRRFYQEGGISVSGIARAAWNDLRGGPIQGGSTITQQLVKNYYLVQDRTIRRKITDIILAIKIDRQLSKQQILEDYLNTIYFGRGTYGIQAASRAYFGVDASQLTVEQGAVLAGMVQSPGFYAPETNMDGLKDRYSYVLNGMVTSGWLTPAERAAATFPKILPAHAPSSLAGPSGYLLETVRLELLHRGFTDADLSGRGLRVVSSFDKARQAAAVAAVAAQRPKTNAQGVRVGLVSVDPSNGAIVAMYGGADYQKQQFNDATQAQPQAGSTFKPFTLSAALENGVSLYSTWNGHSPRTFVKPDGSGTYTVPNYGNESFGMITLMQATADSVNTVYVDVNQTIGSEKSIDAARRAGVPNDVPIDNGLTVPLGTASPTVLDMAGAYATFAAQGLRTQPTSILSVKTFSGGVLYQLNAQPARVFAPDVMADVTWALQGVVTNGSGFAAQQLGRPSAGKTGTTNSNRSAWYVGYTPQLATAVAMFRPNSDGSLQSMAGVGGMASVTGGSFPARMWTAYMSAALKGTPVVPFPKPAYIGGQPTPSASASPTATPTPTASASATGSPSATASGSPTDSGSPSPAPSASSSGLPGPGPSGAASPAAASPSSSP